MRNILIKSSTHPHVEYIYIFFTLILSQSKTHIFSSLFFHYVYDLKQLNECILCFESEEAQDSLKNDWLFLMVNYQVKIKSCSP